MMAAYKIRLQSQKETERMLQDSTSEGDDDVSSESDKSSENESDRDCEIEEDPKSSDSDTTPPPQKN